MRWLLTSPSKFATIDTIRPLAVRSSQEIARFFDRLELLIESGVVSVSLWRPDPHQVGAPTEVNTFGGVGRKP